jgi:hypothetical protein
MNNPIYIKLLQDFRAIRQAKELSSQDIAGEKNCSVYSFEHGKRFVKASTLVEWLEKMDCHLEIVKNKKSKL